MNLAEISDRTGIMVNRYCIGFVWQNWPCIKGTIGGCRSMCYIIFVNPSDSSIRRNESIRRYKVWAIIILISCITRHFYPYINKMSRTDSTIQYSFSFLDVYKGYSSHIWMYLAKVAE